MPDLFPYLSALALQNPPFAMMSALQQGAGGVMGAMNAMGSQPQPQGGQGQNPGIMGLEDILNKALSQSYNPSEDNKTLQDALTQKALSDITVQHEQRLAQLNGVMARLKALSEGMTANPYPQHEMMASQGAYPQFQAPEVPQRGKANIDPISRMLAGIAAGLAPGQYSGELLASPFQGALQHSDQAYQDRLKGYQMRYQQAQQKHEDELNARNEEAKRQAFNIETTFGNKLGSWTAQNEYLNKAVGPLAQAESEIKSEKAPSTAQETSARAGATAEGTREAIRSKEAASREREGLTARIFSPYEQMTNRENQTKAQAERDKRKAEADIKLEKERQTGRMALEGARGGTAIKVAGIRSEASKFGSTVQAEATIKAAELRADAPSKSQSGELKGASMYFRQAKRELRRFELENPLNLRLARGDKGEALRHQWTQLHDDVLDAADQVNAAKDETPMPSNPIGRTGQKKSGGMADFMKRHGIR